MDDRIDEPGNRKTYSSSELAVRWTGPEICLVRAAERRGEAFAVIDAEGFVIDATTHFSEQFPKTRNYFANLSDLAPQKIDSFRTNTQLVGRNLKPRASLSFEHDGRRFMIRATSYPELGAICVHHLDRTSVLRRFERRARRRADGWFSNLRDAAWIIGREGRTWAANRAAKECPLNGPFDGMDASSRAELLRRAFGSTDGIRWTRFPGKLPGPGFELRLSRLDADRALVTAAALARWRGFTPASSGFHVKRTPEDLGDHFILIDASGSVSVVDDRGIRRQERHFLSNEGREDVEPEFRRLVADALSRAWSGNGVVQFEVRAALLESAPRWWSVVGRKLEMAATQTMLAIFVRDVTPQHVSTDALRASEANYRGLLEAVPGPVVVLDAEMGYLYGNAHYNRTFASIDPSVVLGGSPDRALLLEAFQAALIGASVSLEAGLSVAAGRLLTYNLSFGPAPWSGGPSVLVVGIDVTERAELKSSLARAERLATIGTIVAGVAHEINNPLTYLALNGDQLRTTLSEALPRSHPIWARLDVLLDDARFGVERVREIVRDLKRYARVDLLVNAKVRIGDILAQSRALVQNELRYRAKFVISVPPEVQEAMVIGDGGRLAQVLVNLLLNAGHAIEGPWELNQILLTGELVESRLVLRVTDTGRGIPQENLERIFVPFFTTKPQGEGTGLGLSICQRIVEEHGGKIGVESTPGVGSTFEVTLPLDGTISAVPQVVQPPIAQPSTRRQTRVLVVDDDPRVRRALSAVLSMHFEVMETASGNSARRLLESGALIDVVVCDLMMNDGTGRDLYSWASTARPDLAQRVVFLTGGAVTPDLAEFVRAQGRAVLEKPVDALVLIDRLNSLLDS